MDQALHARHCSNSSQVSVTECIALPLRIHRGCPEEGILLHTSASIGEKKAPRYDYLAVRWALQFRITVLADPEVRQALQRYRIEADLGGIFAVVLLAGHGTGRCGRV